MTKYIKIDPYTQTVQEVELGDHKEIQKAIGCHTFTAAYPQGWEGLEDNWNPYAIYVDDEGIYDNTAFFLVRGLSQPLAGVGIVALADDEGNPVDIDKGVDWIKQGLEFYTLMQTENGNKLVRVD